MTDNSAWADFPGTRSAPPPQPPATPPAVGALHGTAAEQAAQALGHAQAAHQNHLQAVGSDERSTPEAKLLRFAGSPAAKAVDEAVEIAQSRVGQAETEVAQIRQKVARPADDLVTQTKAARTWARAQRVLDSADSSSLVPQAQRLVAEAAGNPADFAVPLEEIEPYMRSRKASTEWIDPAIAAVSPDYATARQRLQKATQARDIVVNGANSLRHGFKNGTKTALL